MPNNHALVKFKLQSPVLDHCTMCIGITAGGNQLHLESMAESGESEYQYSYTAIKEYLRAVVYPDGYDKQSKHAGVVVKLGPPDFRAPLPLYN